MKKGHVNVDFADVKTVMSEKGIAVMGTGRASGKIELKLLVIWQ